jgi:hypothetical protein
VYNLYDVYVEIVREDIETGHHPNSRKVEDGLMFSRS